MDENALNELLECSVCLERLDGTSKVLPKCQHTFCRRCLEQIVSTKNELRCPECRELVEVPVEELPCNILLNRLLEGMKNAKVGIGVPSPSTSKGSNSSGSSSKHLFNNTSSENRSRSHGVNKTPIPSQPCAKALYNYDAKELGDLSFKKGDVIFLQKQVDENWYHGYLDTNHGFFPATYVQVLVPLPQELPTCKSLYDFIIDDKNEKDCLMFQKDEVITVLRRVDDNWAEGRLGERIGIFPISFVEMNDAAKWLINSQARACLPILGTVSPGGSGSDSSPEGIPSPPSCTLASLCLLNPSLAAVHRAHKRHSISSLSSHPRSVPPAPHHRHSVELSPTTFNGPLLVTTSTVTSPTVSSQTSNKPSGNVTHMSPATFPEGSPAQSASTLPAPSTSAAHIYVALYNYKPRKEDELELRKGDYYHVAERCQDGWYRGKCLRDATQGVFPGNYVQPVKLSKHATASRVPHHSSSSSNNAAVTAGVNEHASPGKPAHVTVSRAHSFPKTSPLAVNGSEYPAQAAEGEAMVNGTSGSHASTPQDTPTRSSTSRPRTSTVPSQPQTVAGVRPHAQPAPTMGPALVPRTQLSSSGRGVAAASGEGKVSRSTQSPRSNRKSRHTASHAAPLSASHSMSPSGGKLVNPVVGAMGGDTAPALPVKEREKSSKTPKERREKDRLSIVRRLTKSKKSKSPPPEQVDSPSSLDPVPHQRSSSLPTDGASGSHGKTRSLDASTQSPGLKPPRTKPLLRERFRCIVPYPPQSDLELELKVGDIVYVHKRREDGWCKGTQQRTGKTGLFPGSFTEAF